MTLGGGVAARVAETYEKEADDFFFKNKQEKRVNPKQTCDRAHG